MRGLLEEKYLLQKDIKQKEARLKEIESQLGKFTDYTVMQFGNDISKDRTPYIYDLLSQIKYFKSDERDWLEWGRGKNPVEYTGYEFEYNSEKYTAGFAHNYCTNDIFYTEYDNAERSTYELAYDDIENMRTIENENTDEKNQIRKIDEFLEKLDKDVLEKIALLIIFIFTEYGC